MDDSEEDEGGSKMPDKYGYYSGETLAILRKARDTFRCYLFAEVPYPSSDDQIAKVKAAFLAACQDRYGSRHRGKFIL